jgi:integrase/recombinase XerC
LRDLLRMRKSASAKSAKSGVQVASRAREAHDAVEHADNDFAEFGEDTAAALQLFQSALLARGAPETTRRYLLACKTLARERLNKTLFETRSQDAQRVLASLHAQGIAPRTLATTLSAWKTWFRVLARHDARYRPDAFDAVRVPKPPKRLPNALTESEMKQLLDADVKRENEVSEWRERDSAMFELLYGCGLRVSELAGLNLEHVDIAAGEVRVYGKGRKERVLPLGAKAREAITAWLLIRVQHVAINAVEGTTALFIGTRGGRIATTVVRRVLANQSIEAGINSHVHPHRLRHSFASHVLQSSRDLRAVQELMGHASIASTQVYTHLDFKHLAAVYDDAHPRASKKKTK